MPELLTVREVMQRLKVSQDTVYRMLHTGKFPHAVRVLDGYRIPDTDVEVLLKPIEHDLAD